jgi:hypothetical protein
MTGTLEQWLAGRRERAVELKGAECTLRVVTAREVLEARREAAALAAHESERALCSNACLLARALHREGQRVFSDGAQALGTLTPGEIENLTAELAALNRAENPSPEAPWEETEERKKAWSTRPMSG